MRTIVNHTTRRNALDSKPTVCDDVGDSPNKNKTKDSKLKRLKHNDPTKKPESK
jgi:hypothetical protein